MESPKDRKATMFTKEFKGISMPSKHGVDQESVCVVGVRMIMFLSRERGRSFCFTLLLEDVHLSHSAKIL